MDELLAYRDFSNLHSTRSSSLFPTQNPLPLFQYPFQDVSLPVQNLRSGVAIDTAYRIDYPYPRPGRPGAAEPSQPRQGRETATVRKCLWVPPVTCSDTIHMRLNRWLFIVLALLAGIAAGLAYGWVIDPVDFYDLTPDTLRADYKADYVLMTAEAYHAEQDPGLAARRLAVFGSQSPVTIASGGLAYARANSFTDSDIALVQELVTALQAWSGIP